MTDDVVEGRIVFGDDAEPFEGAAIHLVIEDTTATDAAAIPVASVVLHAIAYDGRPGGGIPFRLSRSAVGAGRRHTLRVLVDVDGDGRLGRGDYRNAESVPLPGGAATNIDVRVRRVR